MRFLTFLLLLVFFSCGDGKKYHDEQHTKISGTSPVIADILAYQKALNTEYKNPETSPLPDRLRIHFEGLDFFEPNEDYVVKARLELQPDSKPFNMPTTTGDKSRERVYAIAHFKLNGQKRSLEIYQSIELIEEEGYEDYLFLPFLDATNGNETYGGGRYIDLRLPKGDSITIDFNKAYNPYCVYNKKYSCPIVPRHNYLNTKVKAGVKDFKSKKGQQ